MKFWSVCLGALLLMALAACPTGQAAILIILNEDAPGEGFNDPTPVVPVPGNPGTTRGEQRLRAFQAAADAWGSIIDSAVPIPVIARMDPLPCSATSGILGLASPTLFIASGDQLPRKNTFYPFALANALVGEDLSEQLGHGPGSPNIRATFNSRVDDDPGCLSSIIWWYGIGTPAPAGTADFFITVYHEIAHGLGFTTLVDLKSGARLFGLDDVYMLQLEDHSTGKLWPDMNNAERAISAMDTGDLHWVGAGAGALGAIGLSQGRHPGGHIQMYAPTAVSEGSSVSHWDTALTPNDIMEPFLQNDAQNVVTTGLMADIGWRLAADATPVAHPVPAVGLVGLGLLSLWLTAVSIRRGRSISDVPQSGRRR